PEQIDKLGLKPWDARKLYCRWDNPAEAQVVMDLRTSRAALRDSGADFAAPAVALLNEEYVPAATQAAYRSSHVDGADKHRTRLEGATLAYGGAARRAHEPPAEPDPKDEAVQKLRRQLQAFVEAPEVGLADPNRIMGQIGPLLKNLPDEQGAPAAFALTS